MSDVMRKVPLKLTETQIEDIDYVKDLGEQLHDAIEELGDSREASIAKTRLEEAVMWTVKAITSY